MVLLTFFQTVLILDLSSIIFFINAVDISDKGLVGMGAGMATTGCLGAGIGQGFSAGKAAEAIGRNPESESKVRTIMIIGAAIAESGSIYALLVALILMFVYSNNVRG